MKHALGLKVLAAKDPHDQLGVEAMDAHQLAGSLQTLRTDLSSCVLTSLRAGVWCARACRSAR